MTKLKLWILLALVLCSTASFAETRYSSSSEILLKDGFHLQGDLGMFFRFGSGLSMSRVEPLVGLSVGYDFSRNVGIGLKLAGAFSSYSSLLPSNSESPTAFGLYLINANVMGAISIVERLRVVANAFGGLTIMSPPSTPNASSLGGNVGVSLGILYDTFLADTVLGLNVSGYGFFGLHDDIFFGISIAPVIKYVF